MTVSLLIVLPTFFLTFVPLFMTSFAFLFSISATLGDFCLAMSDCITLVAWLSVNGTLGGDAVLILSYRWVCWNIFCSLLIASLVLYHWSRNSVLGWGFLITVMKSCVTCVSLSSNNYFGMYKCAGKVSTVLLTRYPLVVGM